MEMPAGSVLKPARRLSHPDGRMTGMLKMRGGGLGLTILVLAGAAILITALSL
jgi:hypothetical protein